MQNKRPRKTKRISPMEVALISKYKDISHNPQKYPRESKWIAPRNTSVKGIKYISFLGSTGYAEAAKGYIRSLAESGFYVLVEPVKYCSEQESEILSKDDYVLSVCLHNTHIEYDSVIIHSLPTNWMKYSLIERAKNPSVKIYGLTVWETDMICPTWLNLIIQAGLNGLIVPSDWNRQTFIESSKANLINNFPPVFVCHHAITDRQQREARLSLKREHMYGHNIKVAFLCIGTWTPRKGIEETIRTYLESFKGHNDVVLYLKTTTGTGKYADEDSAELRQKLDRLLTSYPNPPKIILDTKLRSDDYIDDLVKNCDVYVSMCNSEGVGLGACQAALNGKIVIMTGYGGQKEYISQGHWINYKLDIVNVPENFVKWIRPPQRWGYPDLQHAIQCLQEVYNNMPNYVKLSQQNREFILQKYSYLACGQQFKSILTQLNSIKDPSNIISCKDIKSPINIKYLQDVKFPINNKPSTNITNLQIIKPILETNIKVRRHDKSIDKKEQKKRTKEQKNELKKFKHNHDICERCHGLIL